MAQGWISVHRSIEDNPLWLSEPFTKAQAWIDLLLMANHEPKQIIIKGKPITIQRGQRLTHERYLADRWKWSRGKVRRYLELLTEMEMICTESDTTNGTTITIENYNKYQDWQTTNSTTDGPQTVQQTDHRQYLNNNELIMINNEDKYNIETIPYKEIINYLNEVTGSNYSHTTDKTKRLIKARINEGHDINDFKKVIDNKYNSWNGTEWQKYLRPSTLFGTKFEGYLNEKVNNSTIQSKSKKPQIKDSDISYEERQAFLQKKLAQKIPINLKGE